jgi:hypothetical protein
MSVAAQNAAASCRRNAPETYRKQANRTRSRSKIDMSISTRRGTSQTSASHRKKEIAQFSQRNTPLRR